MYRTVKGNKQMLKNDNIISFSHKVHNICGIPLPSNRKMERNILIKIKKKLQQNFASYWSLVTNTSLSRQNRGGNKLCTYIIFKKHFHREEYLNIANPSARRTIAKFRLSAHKLRIESARYDCRNKYIPPEERICTNCDQSKTEDEFHFLLHCPKYNDLRKKLYENISLNNRIFMDYNGQHKFIWLLSNENLSDIKSLASFIETGMSLRR